MHRIGLNKTPNYFVRGSGLLTVQSPFQSIVFEKTKNGLTLFLNDEIQFAQNYERGYHHALAGSAIAKKPRSSDVLILGGGDGLAARTLFEYNPNVRVHLAELDPHMVNVCSRFSPMVSLNKGALGKTIFYPGDATRTINRFPDKSMDIVLSDFPDRSLDSMSLYEPSVYNEMYRVLKPGGILSVYPGGDESAVLGNMRPQFNNVSLKNTEICDGLVCRIAQGVKPCLY